MTAKKKEDEHFEIVRTYVKENHGCNMQEVSDETGVELRLITKFIREKRIEFADGSNMMINCDSCGVPISSGRYCNACLNKLGREMLNEVKHSKPAVEQKEPSHDKPSSGVHISRIKK